MHVPEEIIEKLIANRDINDLSYEQIIDDFRAMEELEKFRPTGICRVDPRNGDRVIYSPMRSRRPTQFKARKHVTVRIDPIACPVCEGKTSTIIDLHPLSSGYTFINKNIFPVVSYDYPSENQPQTREPAKEKHQMLGTYAQGGHWLQWISSFHDIDLHNMPVEDIAIVLSRLALFEGKLMKGKQSNMPVWTDTKGRKYYGFVGIIRNFGQMGGASLAHGHLQITHTNVIPKAIIDDREYYTRNGRSFPNFLLEENPAYLNVRDFGAFRLAVPYFMKRPYSSFLMCRNTSICALHQLDSSAINDLAEALSAMIKGVRYLLDKLERSFAYNLIFHNGPSGSLYIELLPHSQEWGGYEHMGWFICQATPVQAADGYREAFKALGV